jgi:hypothetical protein
MATSSIWGAEKAPTQAEGRDVEALGPSDTSDSGSDVQGVLDLADPLDLDNPTYGAVQPGLDSATDFGGTGERGAALPGEEAREGGDILPDRIGSFSEEAEASDGATAAELEFAELADSESITTSELDREDDDDNDDDLAKE